MTARLIQGFFIGGRMRWPTGASLPPVAQRFAAPGAAAAQRPMPGPPPPLHQPVMAAQAFGGTDSFAIDPAQVGLARGGGSPLPQAVLTKMEAAFDADFSAVRVHIGPQAARIGAIAFTTGNDLYFAPGQFQPESVKGQQLIGHELAHVIQQRQGRVRAPGSGVSVVQDRALEAEADRLGMRAAAHRGGTLQCKTAAAAGGAPRISTPMREQGGAYRLRADMGGREVGSVRMHLGQKSLALTDLGIDPAYRAQGLGKQLLANAARAGMALGKNTLSLSAQDDGSGRLTRWYKAMGFAQTGTNGRGYAELEISANRLLSGAVQRKMAPLAPPRRPGTIQSSMMLKTKEAPSLEADTVTLYRFLSDKSPKAFTPQKPMSKEEILKWGRQYEGDITLEMAIFLMGEHHAQNMLGTDNIESPFLSLASDPLQVARAGTLRDIVYHVKEFWSFDIPKQYIVPVGNEVSKGEGEVLVWVPDGKTLKTLSKYNPEAHHNPWRGLSLSEIREGKLAEVWYGKYLK